MIQVLLLLLKIIGIVIAVLLLLVLLIVTLVLFAPIRYRARVVHTPDREEISGRASFLFPLAAFHFRYFEKTFFYKGRFAWYVFAESGKNKEKPEKKEKKATKVQETQTAAGKDAKSDSTQPVQEDTKQTEPVSEISHQPEAEKTGKEKRKKVKKEKTKEEKSEKGETGFLDKIRRLLRQKDEVVRILKEPEHKRTFGFVWDKVKKTFRHILPQKAKGYLIYGNADPAVTGQILGIVSVLYAAMGPVLRIVPDFEKERLECDLEFRGRLRVFTLLVILLKLYFNKELKKLIQELKAIKSIE